MPTLLTLAAILPPAAPLQAAETGILDRTNTLFTEAQETLSLGATLVVSVLLILMVVKGGFTFSKLLIALVVGGLAWWLFLGDALPFIGDSIKDQVDAAATNSSIGAAGFDFSVDESES